jgi:hypothetical protein
MRTDVAVVPISPRHIRIVMPHLVSKEKGDEDRTSITVNFYEPGLAVG